MRNAADKSRIRRVLRPLIGVVVAYAVAAQSLLIAIGGFTLPVAADSSAPAFELCVHDSGGSPEQPAKAPTGSACTHCIFCFAGSHDAVIDRAPGVFHRVEATLVVVRLTADKHSLPNLPAHAIASPRGPPLRA
jgi:hypothetical protein